NESARRQVSERAVRRDVGEQVLRQGPDAWVTPGQVLGLVQVCRLLAEADRVTALWRIRVEAVRGHVDREPAMRAVGRLDPVKSALERRQLGERDPVRMRGSDAVIGRERVVVRAL